MHVILRLAILSPLLVHTTEVSAEIGRSFNGDVAPELVFSEECLTDPGRQPNWSSLDLVAQNEFVSSALATYSGGGIVTCCKSYVGSCLPFTPHITCRHSGDCDRTEFCDISLSPPTCLRRSLHGSCSDGTHCASGSCNLITGLCDWPQPAGDQSCIPGNSISGCPIDWVCDPASALCVRQASYEDPCSLAIGAPVTLRCDRDTRCVPDYRHPGEWYCDSRTGEGEQCHPKFPAGYECAPGTACSVRQRCEQPQDSGDCFNNDDCQSGLCRWQPGGRRGKCDPPASQTGGPCQSYHDCPHGNICSNGRCRN